MNIPYKFVTASLFLILLNSCDSSDAPIPTGESYTITANLAVDDVWSSDNTSAQSNISRAADDNPVFQIYLFDSNNTAMDNNGGYMTKLSTGKTFNTISSPGSYTFYGITNLLSGEWTSTVGNPKPVVTTESTFTLSTESAPRDICLGKQTINVSASTHAYSVSISAAHIMSRLALTVKSVPSDVTSMTITLPNQANVFNFIGTFTGNSTSQTLTLNRATSANVDGTFDWTCEPTIVFPCASGATSMPLQITWGSASVSSKTVNTSSSICCLSGKNLSLSTTWSESYRTSAVITTSEWNAVEKGTFPW